MFSEVFKKFPILKVNDFCHLRQFKALDAKKYFEFYKLQEINRFLPNSMIPSNIEDSKQEIESIINVFKDRESIYWAIARNEDDALIGGCGFLDWNRYHSRIEMAYDLHPQYWRNGIMSSCIKVVIQYGFSYLALKRIQATTVTYNEASNKLLLKLGFKYEGLLRNYKFFKGETIDVMMFGYTIEDFLRDVGLNKYE